MKQAKWIVAVALVVLSGMAIAAAQLDSSYKIVAQVPFEFVVANRIVPAGQCVVQVAPMDDNTLMIHNWDNTVALFSPASRIEGKQGTSQYTLVFNHYGNRYFLTGIKIADSKITYRVPESKGESELRAQNVSSTQEVVLASLK
jgi:hypothetical protein